MSFAVTLISSPADPQVDDDLIDRAGKAIGGGGPPIILDDGVACDFVIDAAPQLARPSAIGDLVDRLQAVLDGRRVDIAIQPTAFRRKRLLLADMDQTLIGQESIDELADLVGKKAEVAAVTERAMRGEIEFEHALAERAAHFAGADARLIDTVIDERLTLNPGGRELVATMHAHGAYCGIVSGGFVQFTGHVAAQLGFDEHHANELQIVDGRLTGRVTLPITGKEGKRRRLAELTGQRHLRMEETLCVGDGANDEAMIRAAGLGVAYHAKPVVAAAADVVIRHGDLTALLYLQGYRRSEFVSVSGGRSP